MQITSKDEQARRNEEAKISGSRPALIESFEINGLFGYRNIALSSKYAATILIAKNGAGKTTLLGAMDAFLKCQFARLSELQFSTIQCKLKDIPEKLVLHKSDIDEIAKEADNPEFQRLAKQNELDPIELLHFVNSEYSLLKAEPQELYGHQIYRKVYMQGPHTRETTQQFFSEVEKLIINKNKRIGFIQSQIKKALSNIEIVYLPTYRRIELSLPDVDIGGKFGRAQSVQSKLGINKRRLQSGEIQFGLSDISSRLAKLNQDMLIQSNEGYREISANIINDLIDGGFEVEPQFPEDIPSREALNLFFSRLSEGVRFVGPYNDLKIPNFRKIYEQEGIPENSRRFLTYFLGKLNKVLQKTEDVEGLVQAFVDSCNNYLSEQDESVNIPGSPKKTFLNNDNKVLKLDKRNLGVSVSSVDTDRKIPLDALSSGEKQMISLFARLYLYPKRKLLLIDEPELSLSIDWQRKILVDIMSADLCQQIIAITHSPFVFDNSLEPFAKSLKLEIDRNAPNPSSKLDEEDDINA
jgi:predicted ATPase